MFYKKNQDFRLVGYSDVDYVGYKVQWKSTSGGATILDLVWYLGQVRSITLLLCLQ